MVCVMLHGLGALHSHEGAFENCSTRRNGVISSSFFACCRGPFTFYPPGSVDWQRNGVNFALDSMSLCAVAGCLFCLLNKIM